MTIRARVADRTGKLLAELEPSYGPISWRLNDVGKAEFMLAKTDPKATADLLKFGNRLLLQFDNGLPAWGGMIDPPRSWEGAEIEVTAYSGEYLLGMRQTDKSRYFSNANVGYIFEKLIVEANAKFLTGIEFGTAWGGGDGHSPELHFKNLLDFFQDSICQRLENADFEIVPSVASGYITFTAHLYERRGSDKSAQVALLEGHNVAPLRLAEQGPIVNSYDLAGEGVTWGADRITSHKDDAASISDFGLREDSKVFADTSIQATLDSTAANLLAETKQPRNRLALEALNLKPALFASYDVGDTIRVQLHSYGFGGYDHAVRVLTREYQPDTQTCVLVVEEDD